MPPELDARWVLSKRWRVGRKLGRTLYAQIGAEPGLEDVVLGMVDDARIAQAICDEHNAQLATEAALPTVDRVVGILRTEESPSPWASIVGRPAGAPLVDPMHRAWGRRP